MPPKMKFCPNASRPKDIDLLIPGLGIGYGRNADRFRASSETHSPKLYRERQEMVRDLGRRLLFDVLKARLEGRITTNELHHAYKQGPATLSALAATTAGRLLSPLLTKYMLVNKGRDKEKTRKQIQRFVTWAGGDRATTAALTTDNLAGFLDSLLSEGKHAGSPVSGATQNRYRAALGGFCSYLVRDGQLLRHPTAFRALAKADEGEHRLPSFTNADYRAYFDALPVGDAALALVFRFLIHTGGDIGEVLTRTVRDCDFDRSVPRVRFKRTKTRTPQRLVPYPEMFVPELQAHIRSNGLGPNALLFGMLKRSRIDAAHQKARKLIGQSELRIKDFRHVAAIMWRRAGVDLESIRQWLGHATINQTVIYSNFAPDDEYDGPKVNRAAELLSGPSRILPFPSQLAG